PAAGGIVEVVLSIGALTGVPLYGPPIRAWFSGRLTAISIYFTSAFSPVGSLFFKFLSPPLLEITLDRTQEMVLGVSLPLLLLVFVELYYALQGKSDERAGGEGLAPGAEEAVPLADGEAARIQSRSRNKLAIRVI